MEIVHIPSPTQEEELDQDTTISRSFWSGAKHPSSSTNKSSLARSASRRSCNKEMCLTLNERFATLSNSAQNSQEANISNRSNSSSQSELSQFRILTLPRPSEQGDLQPILTHKNHWECPSSLLSNISKRSVRQGSRIFLGSYTAVSEHLFVQWSPFVILLKP